MLTTLHGTFKKGRVELMETPFGMEEEATVLVTFLPQELVPSKKQPAVLYGAWRDKFPADFDMETALKEIRYSWHNEWDEESLAS